MPLSPPTSSTPATLDGPAAPPAMAAPSASSTANNTPRNAQPPTAVALASEGELKAAAILFEQMTAHASKSAADPDAVAVARFLRTTPLSRSVVGDLLGEPAPRALAVLDAYARSFPWAGVPFEAGLRSFLEAFRLPGEAQKIYRVLDAWSQAYFDANKAGGGGVGGGGGGDGGGAGAPAPTTGGTSATHPTFASADAVHVLAFSAILLNTDAHTAAVRRKMSAPEFVANNRGINGGSDLPAPFLEGLYQSIVARPIRAPPGAGRERESPDDAAAVGGPSPSAGGGGGGGFLAAVGGNGHPRDAPALSSSPSGGLARLGSRARSRSGAGGWGGSASAAAAPAPPPSPPGVGVGRPSSGGGGWLLAGGDRDRAGPAPAPRRRRPWWACLGPPA